MAVKGSLNCVFLTWPGTLWPLPTFSSQFLFPVLSCRISSPALGLPVPLAFFTSPSHSQWCWRPLVLALTPPHSPSHSCVQTSAGPGFTLHPHSPKGATAWNRPSSCGRVGCWVRRDEGGAAGWGHKQCPQPLLPPFPSNLLSEGLAPREHIPQLT